MWIDDIQYDDKIHPLERSNSFIKMSWLEGSVRLGCTLVIEIKIGKCYLLFNKSWKKIRFRITETKLKVVIWNMKGRMVSEKEKGW